jgi:hypothetical protein
VELYSVLGIAKENLNILKFSIFSAGFLYHKLNFLIFTSDENVLFRLVELAGAELGQNQVEL